MCIKVPVFILETSSRLKHHTFEDIKIWSELAVLWLPTLFTQHIMAGVDYDCLNNIMLTNKSVYFSNIEFVKNSFRHVSVEHHDGSNQLNK